MSARFKDKRSRFWLCSFFVFLFALSILDVGLSAPEAEQVSKFGEYKGYSEPIYDSWVRSSQYLTMRDGIKIAIDIIRPAKNGVASQEPLPAIWTHTRYRRALIKDGKVISEADSPFAQQLIKYGYIIAAADVRGSGASFGSWQGIWTREESQDAYEITEWLASQPWCDGKVGMMGGSYLGVTQLMAASTKPPHLKAIFPIVALFDIYPVGYHGGVFCDDLIRTWSEMTKLMDTERVAASVDDDKDGSLLKGAVEEHKSSRTLIEIMSPLRYRNDRDEMSGVMPNYEWHPAAFVEEINQSGVPIYLWGGWFDSFTKDGFLMFRNFKNAKKIVMGAWSHSPRDREIAKELIQLAAAEELRWFDYWLKGIDNGIMTEPPIRYQVMIAPKKNEWRTAEKWPLPMEMPKKFYFHGGRSGSVKSMNDGILSKKYPSEISGEDSYTVDYTTTTGQASRWDNAVGGGFEYPDMTANDQKGLTYTTEPLTEDVEVTGHPLIHLWTSSTATDGDFFVYLEEVDGQGFSHYLSEGTLRASHRTLHEPYYDNLGLPFHRSHKEDVVKLGPDEAAELVFDLQPISNVFNAGHRIRITLTCIDKDNASTPVLSPPPTVTVFRNTGYASFISLPVIPAEAEAEFPLLVIVLVAAGIVILVILFTIFIQKRVKR